MKGGNAVVMVVVLAAAAVLGQNTQLVSVDQWDALHR
jgi:hypothetical protein